jgi:amino-acid N-acetyltransferase
MSITFRSAQTDDVSQIVSLVNRFAAQNIMLPRTEDSVRQTLPDWIIAIDNTRANASNVVGCGALVPLTNKLAEVRSLAIHESQQGKGLGGEIVLKLVESAKEQEYEQVCALTLRENFFIRLGFKIVDRWQISPKVWQACIYCPKFHHCDEVAVLMDLRGRSDDANDDALRNPGWNTLLKWEAWQPLKLAYRSDPDEKVKLKS